MLGVCRRQVDRLAEVGALRKVKIGRLTRFRLSDLERVMEEGIVAAP